MKKIKFLLIFSAFIIAGISVNAQSIGFKSGVTFSNLNTDPDYIESYVVTKPGVEFGVMVSMPIFPMFDFKPEVIVFQKGDRHKGEILGVAFDYKSTINYIDVPLNIRFKPPVLPVYAIAGPYIGYAFQGSSYSKVGDFVEQSDINFQNHDFSTFDLGVNAGLGFIKDFGPLHFFVEARYNYGFLDLEKSDYVIANNTNISVAAGIMLGFK